MFELGNWASERVRWTIATVVAAAITAAVLKPGIAGRATGRIEIVVIDDRGLTGLAPRPEDKAVDLLTVDHYLASRAFFDLWHVILREWAYAGLGLRGDGDTRE